MPFAVRPLTRDDIAQSAEIERDAFPTMFPPTPFARELKNRRASYLVAVSSDPSLVPQPDAAGGEGERRAPAPRHSRHSRAGGNPSILLRWLRTAAWWRIRPPAWQPGQDYLVGFLGIWYSVDEAHIVSVGVRREYRRRGIGEMLLIAGIEQAVAKRVEVVTLEVRVSNDAARGLYSKYGFAERGLRKAYYKDNREDALIMTTDSILGAPFSARFGSLVDCHERRWGRFPRIHAQ